MAKVTVTLEDGDKPGKVIVTIVGDEKLTPSDRATTAQKWALGVSELIRQQRPSTSTQLDTLYETVADRVRLLELREKLKTVLGDSAEAVEIRTEMGAITEKYLEHDELVEDWDEYCECSECMSYGDHD